MKKRRSPKELQDVYEKVRSQTYDLIKILFTLESGSFIILPFARSIGVSKGMMGLTFSCFLIALCINFLAYIQYTSETLNPDLILRRGGERSPSIFKKSSLSLLGLSLLVWFLALSLISWSI